MCLVLWEVWKPRNAIVFDSPTPSVGAVLGRILEEAKAWKMVGLLRRDMQTFLRGCIGGAGMTS